MIDYYWCQLIIKRQPIDNHYGWCTYYPTHDVAMVLIDPTLTEKEALSTLVHELGHVWQGLKKSDLTTKIKWPSNHLGASSIREDFPECLRVALVGLDSCADETITFTWVRGVTGLYQMETSQEEQQLFVDQCRQEVIRLLGYIPTVPGI